MWRRAVLPSTARFVLWWSNMTIYPSPPTQEAPSPRKDAMGRWLPGVSGNPAGRAPNAHKKVQPWVAAEVRRAAREYAREIIEGLADLMRDRDAPPAVRKSAMDALLDRGYGKAVQPIEAGGPGSFDNMADDELDAYINDKLRQRGLLIDG